MKINETALTHAWASSHNHCHEFGYAADVADLIPLVKDGLVKLLPGEEQFTFTEAGRNLFRRFETSSERGTPVPAGPAGTTPVIMTTTVSRPVPVRQAANDLPSFTTSPNSAYARKETVMATTTKKVAPTTAKTSGKAVGSGKPSPNGVAHQKEGLRKAQVRILELLAKKPANEATVAEKAPVDKAWLPDALFGRMGDIGDEKVITKATPLGKERSAKVGYPSLLLLGYVRAKVIEAETGRPERVWEITASGKKALADHHKAEAAKE